MAKKANTRKKKGSESSTILDAIVAGITKHWDVHHEEFLKFVTESKNKEGVMNFGCFVDQSASETAIEVKVRFSATVTDNLNFTVTDPTQGRFEEFDKVDSRPKKKKEKEEPEVEGEEE